MKTPKFSHSFSKLPSLNDQVTPDETMEILHLAEYCLATPGDFVELGCYRGDTSVLLGQLLQTFSSKFTQNSASCGKSVENLCKSAHQPVQNLCKNPPKPVEKTCKTPANSVQNPCKTSKNQCKNLWIYDSFAGLPNKTAPDLSGAGQNFQKGELLVSKREVVVKLRKHGLKTSSAPLWTPPSSPTTPPNSTSSSNAPIFSDKTSSSDLTTSLVIVKKAWFEDLTASDLPAEIAFAFLDGDLYQSIQTSLQLVAPRLHHQGIIIVHDYNNPELPGSARAVDQFLHAHPEFSLRVHYTLAILTKKC